MHEPAGVVEILVQILQNTPILKYSFRIPPLPENGNCQRSWHFDFSVSEYPPPPKIEIWADLGTLTFQFSEYPPPPKIEILGISWHFDFSDSEYPPGKLKFGHILAL